MCWYLEEEASNCSRRWLDLIKKGLGGRAKTQGMGEWLVGNGGLKVFLGAGGTMGGALKNYIALLSRDWFQSPPHPECSRWQ